MKQRIIDIVDIFGILGMLGGETVTTVALVKSVAGDVEATKILPFTVALMIVSAVWGLLRQQNVIK